MAQKVLVQLVDDLDGTDSPDIETVEFGLDGVTYEIDLGPENAESLRSGLAGFIDAARRTGGRLKRGAGPRTTTSGNHTAPAGRPGSGRSKEELAAIREWGRANADEYGFEPPADRGRIGDAVVAAFDEAHKPKSPAKQKTAAARATGRRGGALNPAFRSAD